MVLALSAVVCISQIGNYFIDVVTGGVGKNGSTVAVSLKNPLKNFYVSETSLDPLPSQVTPENLLQPLIG